jgi:hypothetical protein
VAAVLLSEDGSGPFRLCEDGLPIVQAAAWALGATSIAGAFLAAYGRWSRNKVLLWLLLWIPIAVVTALAGWLIVFGTGLCGE